MVKVQRDFIIEDDEFVEEEDEVKPSLSSIVPKYEEGCEKKK